MPEEKEAAPAPAAAGGLMSGVKGWIIAGAVVLLEAVFFLTYIHLAPTPAEVKEPAAPTVPLLTDDNNRKVEITKLTYVVQGGGTSLQLTMDVVLWFNYTDDERANAGDPKKVPSTGVLDAYKAYAEASVGLLKDHMISFMQTLTPSAITGATGQQRIRDEIQTYMNGILANFAPPDAPPGLDRRRVTKVGITNWLYDFKE